MNTPEGGKNIRETMIKKYGSEAAYKAFMQEIGRRGGRNSGTGGFYHAKVNGNDELIRAAGSKGGKVSKRPKNTPVDYIPEPPKKKFLIWSR